MWRIAGPSSTNRLNSPSSTGSRPPSDVRLHVSFGPGRVRGISDETLDVIGADRQPEHQPAAGTAPLPEAGPVSRL